MSENLESGRAIVGPRGRRLQAASLLLPLPAAVLFRSLAFRFPGVVEATYAAGVYPKIAATLGLASGLWQRSLAELLAPVLSLAVVWLLVRAARRTSPGAGRTRRAALRVVLTAWGLLGAVAWAFLLLWGLNYARPPLSHRLALDLEGIDATEVLDLGRRLGARAAALRAETPTAGGAVDEPLHLALSFDELDAELDRALRRLRLPGDRMGAEPAPAKPLLSSPLFAYLGISGIYVPFTAEPSVNRLVPDASLPVVVAHEKAHQHGITDEGEANLVGVLACLAARSPQVRYAGYLDAAARLIAAAGVYLPDEARRAWTDLGPGPLADLRAIRDFWDSYRGVATRVAGRVNDAYLRSNRVPGGLQSYGHVVRLLVGADRRGLLARAAAAAE